MQNPPSCIAMKAKQPKKDQWPHRITWTGEIREGRERRTNNNSDKCAGGSQQINFGAEIFAPVNVIIVDYTALTLLD